MTIKIGSGYIKAHDIAVIWDPVYNTESRSYKVGVHLKGGIRVYTSFENKDSAWEFHAKLLHFWTDISNL